MQNAPAAMMSVVFAAEITIVLLTFVSLWRVFSKAGHAGWKALIPLYNMYILTKISGHSGAYFAMMFIPLVNLYAIVAVMNGLAKSFGKGSGFTFGLLLVPMFFYPILAFTDSVYTRPLPPTPALPSPDMKAA